MRLKFFLFNFVLFALVLGCDSNLSALEDDQPESEAIPFEALQVKKEEIPTVTENLQPITHVPVSKLHDDVDVFEDSKKDGILVKPEVEKKRLSLYGGSEDVTRQAQDVRTTKVKAGVGVNVTENSSVGVEASRDFYDQGDASAWNQNTLNAEEAAEVKYKVNF